MPAPWSHPPEWESVSVMYCDTHLPDAGVLYDPKTTPEGQDGVVMPAHVQTAT